MFVEQSERSKNSSLQTLLDMHGLEAKEDLRFQGTGLPFHACELVCIHT